MEVADTKKKPGRPKKNVDTPAADVRGIVLQPDQVGNIVELVCSSPALFKRLMQLYKQFDVSELDLCFSATGLDIHAIDHLGKSSIHAHVDGAQMTRYYCREPVRTCVNRPNLNKVLNILNKNHVRVSFLLKEHNYRSIMYLVIAEAEYDSSHSYDIDVSFNATPAAPALDNDAEYPLQFTFSSKYLKAQINHIRGLSPLFTIQKIGLGPLQLTYPSRQNVNMAITYNDAEKIALHSAVAAEDVFTIDVYIDHIKPFSNSNIGGSVRIAAHQYKKLSFTTQLGKEGASHPCTVKIFTDIIDYSRQPQK